MTPDQVFRRAYTLTREALDLLGRASVELPAVISKAGGLHAPQVVYWDEDGSGLAR